MQEILGRQFLWRGLQTWVIGAFALLAIALAGMGTYAVIAHSVNQRIREIGLRMALGASNATVLRMVIWQGTMPAVFGALLGLAGSLVVGRLTANILFGVTPLDPSIYLGAAGLLSAAALVATYFPARRASLLDPGSALRHE
jgi:putative ABC transport system permease protein